ncbi:hypothetical protein M422DRAFT_276863 [Sphaerobolus stellatus SS14]|uniref:Uncharacterized protein n=1 Tax=Sphaerobolus stellatus (strain SS14) TaxID=990650 RepID=A0A0C9UAX7_SPHS4|nr:hypothetical protein M422DRAFT_276863 [Sphaerobolus stellatus SS14]
MAPKRKTLDEVPAGTSDATDSGSTPHVIGGNDPTLDPGKDPSQAASVASEMNTLHPTTWSTHVTDQLAHSASEQGTSEDPTQTPNPHGGSGDPPLPKTYSDYSEPSERSVLVDPDLKELALGDQIQEMLDTINEHMDELTSIHNMSCQAAQLLAKTNESNSALKARTRTLRTRPIAIREKYPTIAKGKSSIHPRDPNKNPNNEDLGPQPERPSNWSNVDEESTSDQTNQALGRALTELLAKTVILEWLYADEAPADHLNQAATTARSTRMDEDTRETVIWDNPHKSVRYVPFNGIKDNDTDSETTVRNHREGSVPFQQPDNRDILDMSNSESNNALV